MVMWVCGQNPLKVRHHFVAIGIVVVDIWRIYGYELFKVNHHPAKFVDHRHCDSADIYFLVFHVISQDHEIKESIKWFNEPEPIKVSYYHVKFGDHLHSCSWDIMFLVCHVNLQDHVTKGLNNILARSPSRLVITFGGQRHCASRDIMFSVPHVISHNHVTKGSC